MKMVWRIYFRLVLQLLLNENTNRLIRQYFPKTCDFAGIRPRKYPGMKTPNQALFGINPTISLLGLNSPNLYNPLTIAADSRIVRNPTRAAVALFWRRFERVFGV